MPRWAYFAVGQSPALANLTIIGVIHAGETMRTTLYRIKYHCCGSERDLSHEQIRNRQKQVRSTCKPCADKLTGERSRLRAEQEGHVIGSQYHRKRMGKIPAAPDYGVTMPTWPARKSSVGKRYLTR